MTNAQTEARAIARCVRGCATDDQYIELVERIATALAAKDAELAAVKRERDHHSDLREQYLAEAEHAEAQLAEANKALIAARTIIQEDRDAMFDSVTVAGDASTMDEIDRPAVDRFDAILVEIDAARRALTGGREDG